MFGKLFFRGVYYFINEKIYKGHHRLLQNLQNKPITRMF